MSNLIVVSGSRNYSSMNTIDEVLSEVFKEYNGDITIIHGGCSGADSLAGKWARYNKVKVDVFMAEWNKYGKGAGPKRNIRMLDEIKKYKSGRLIAFHENIFESKGTLRMIKEASSRGIKVNLYK